jgi:hypothetical protein
MSDASIGGLSHSSSFREKASTGEIIPPVETGQQKNQVNPLGAHRIRYGIGENPGCPRKVSKSDENLTVGAPGCSRPQPPKELAGAPDLIQR